MSSLAPVTGVEDEVRQIRSLARSLSRASDQTEPSGY